MIPILYAKNETAFESNGKGVLKDAISCVVTEERNGAYTLQLQYPISGNWYRDIGEGSIIKSKANETSAPQLFRIYKSSKPLNGIVTFYANHISYDLLGLPLMSLSLTDTTAQAALIAGLAACPIAHPFTAWSDKTVLEDVNITAPRSLRSFIGGQEGSILSKYAGELEFDNFTVKLHVHRGADNGVTLNYGKNLTDANQERNIEAVYTHVCPFATQTVNTYNDAGEITDQREETVKLTEGVIALPTSGVIGHSKALILDLSDKFGDGEEITETKLRAKAEAYIASHKLTEPAVNITVSMLQTWDTPEYKEFAALERVSLCDTVTVRFEALGIPAKAKVIKTVYDALNERYNTLTIGSAKYSLTDTVAQINEKIDTGAEAVRDNKNKEYADLNNAIVRATNRITGNAGGHVVLHPTEYPSEILIMDSPYISQAVRIWRWNSGGLGYSKNGYNGPFGFAMTMDGEIVADYVKTGTLSAITISGCTIKGGSLNIGDGKFTVDPEGNIHAEGYIKALSGEIGGCSIEKGVLKVPASHITDKLTAAQINANGITATDVDITGKVTATSGEIKNMTITGRLTFGNDENYYIDPNYNDDAYYINLPGFRVDDASGAVFSGTLNAPSGNIGGCDIVKGILKVPASHITDKLTASQINADGIKAKNIDISGKVTATSGQIGNETYNFTIGASGTSASLYCGTASIAGTGGLGSASNQIYLGTDGLSYQIENTGYGYTTVVRSGMVLAYGDTNGSGSFNRAVAMMSDGISFYNSGYQKFGGITNAVDYKIAEIFLDRNQQYALLSGTWKASNSIAVISDRNAKNAIESIDGRYTELIDRLIPRRYKYNDGNSGRYHTGFIAQEVKEAMDAAGLTEQELAALCYDNLGRAGESWSIRYEELIPLIISKLKDIEARVAALIV